MSAPLVVNTKDGVCWTRRAVTSHGIALYAPEAVRTCPEFVMATLDELAGRGIAGTAFVVPAPVGPEPKPRTMLDHGRDALRARMTKDDLRLVLENVITYAASLEAERHSTNESLSEAAEQLRRDRDRIAELEAQRAALAVRLRAGQRWQQGRTPALISQDFVSQDELRSIFGIKLTAPWEAPAEDPCHPCGCPKRFNRHAWGCPTLADDVTPQVQRLRSLLAGQREQAGGPDEWCTGCNTDHNPDECGYRPGAGDAS